MMKNNMVWKVGGIALLVILGFAFIIEPKIHLLGKVYDRAMDNYNHYQSCDQLPTIEEVKSVAYAHRDVANRIITEASLKYYDNPVTPYWGDNVVMEQKESSNIIFDFGNPYPGCEDQAKSDIVITYLSHDERVIIENIIHSDTFFGIPYRLINT